MQRLQGWLQGAHAAVTGGAQPQRQQQQQQQQQQLQDDGAEDVDHIYGRLAVYSDDEDGACAGRAERAQRVSCVACRVCGGMHACV
jgi:hypothetical protein